MGNRSGRNIYLYMNTAQKIPLNLYKIEFTPVKKVDNRDVQNLPCRL